MAGMDAPMMEMMLPAAMVGMDAPMTEMMPPEAMGWHGCLDDGNDAARGHGRYG